jgi:hypothetical protein
LGLMIGITVVSIPKIAVVKIRGERIFSNVSALEYKPDSGHSIK